MKTISQKKFCKLKPLFLRINMLRGFREEGTTEGRKILINLSSWQLIEQKRFSEQIMQMFRRSLELLRIFVSIVQ